MLWHIVPSPQKFYWEEYPEQMREGSAAMCADAFPEPQKPHIVLWKHNDVARESRSSMLRLQPYFPVVDAFLPENSLEKSFKFTHFEALPAPS